MECREAAQINYVFSLAELIKNAAADALAKPYGVFFVYFAFGVIMK